MSAPRIHHLNCGTMTPLGRRLINGEGGLLASARIICHVLLIEHQDGLVLIDTGFGMMDVRGRETVDRAFKWMVRPRLEDTETAISQVRALDLDPVDVRHIVLTHLDIDHTGGLADFPQAEVHLLRSEYEVMSSPPFRERRRYAIAAAHWTHGPRWAKHEPADERWFGLESARVLDDGLELRLISLPGHTLGHAGVAIRQADGWLLHAGDAYFHRDEIAAPASCPPGLKAFETLTQADGRLRGRTQEALRELIAQRAGEVQLICTHDPVELARLSGRR